MSIGVLVVDDDRLVRAGLAAILDGEPDLQVVGEAEDGSQVLPRVRRLRPDVVLMDVRMPRLDGIAATEAVLAAVDEPPKVLVVTTFESDDAVYDALRAGASGFLLKRARPEDLVGAIRLVASGDSLLFPAAIRRLADRHGQRRGGGLPQLTEREAEVLRHVAAGRSNAEIAEALVVSLETVKTHVAGILAKLRARDRTQAVIAAYESGFLAGR